MSVQVQRVSGMPFNVRVWVVDRDDGAFSIYIDEALITEDGARALQQVFNTTIVGWQRLDDSLMRSTLRAVTG